MTRNNNKIIYFRVYMSFYNTYLFVIKKLITKIHYKEKKIQNISFEQFDHNICEENDSFE